MGDFYSKYSGVDFLGPKGFAELDSDNVRAKKFPSGEKHPLKKVPGFPRYASWNAYLGRWVVYRKVVD